MGRQAIQTRMNKNQLVARVQRHMGMGCTRDTARATVNAVLTSIAKVSRAQKLQLRGFGTFYHKQKPARLGHHPLSGELLHIAARSELHFRASTHLEL